MRSAVLVIPPAPGQEPKSTSPTPTDQPGGATGTIQPGTGGQGGPPGSPLGGQCGTETFVMMGLFLLLMWLLVLRPESRRRKEQQQMLTSLQVGDHVVTMGGMHGTLASLTDKTVTLAVGDVRMVFDRSAVARVERATPAPAEPAKGGK